MKVQIAEFGQMQPSKPKTSMVASLRKELQRARAESDALLDVVRAAEWTWARPSKGNMDQPVCPICHQPKILGHSVKPGCILDERLGSSRPPATASKSHRRSEP